METHEDLEVARREKEDGVEEKKAIERDGGVEIESQSAIHESPAFLHSIVETVETWMVSGVLSASTCLAEKVANPSMN